MRASRCVVFLFGRENKERKSMGAVFMREMMVVPWRPSRFLTGC